MTLLATQNRKQVKCKLDIMILEDLNYPQTKLTCLLLELFLAGDLEVEDYATRVDCFDDVVGVVAGEDEATVVLELFNERPEGFLTVLGEVVCFIEEDDFLLSCEACCAGKSSDCVTNITNAPIKTSVDEKEISIDVST